MNEVYIKPAYMVVFLEILYIAYISDFPPSNAADSIANGLLVKKKHGKMSKKVENG